MPDETAPAGDDGHRREIDLAIEITDDERGAVASNDQFGRVYDRIAELVGGSYLPMLEALDGVCKGIILIGAAAPLIRAACVEHGHPARASSSRGGALRSRWPACFPSPSTSR